MRLQNGNLFNPKWGAAFMKVCQLTDMEATDKFKLVKLRKQVVDMIEVLKESLRDLNDEQRERLLKEHNDYAFKPIEQSNSLVDQLSADELYLLEPLFKEEL